MKNQKHLFRLIGALKPGSPLLEEMAVNFVASCSGLRPKLIRQQAAAMAKTATETNPVDLNTVAENFVFDGSGYYLRSEDGKSWGPRCRVDAMLELEKAHGLRRRAGREGGISPAEDALNHVQRTREVDLSVELGGLTAGLHVLNGNRVLVPRERRPIVGVPGDPTTAVDFFEKLLGKDIDPHFPRQWAQLMAWLKWWRQALANPDLHRPRQFMAFVGPSGCGKTVAQTKITAMMGGRQADLGLWLLGETTFNSDAWSSDHIVLSDTTLSNRPGVRKSLRDKIKELVSNPLYQYHAKGKPLRTLPHRWGVSLSCNDDIASATIIPEIDDSAAARFTYLKCYAPPVPFPSTGTPEGDAFWKALDDSLPAFAHYIDTYEIPPEFTEPRWGIQAWRHPAVMELVERSNPDNEIGTLLDDLLIAGGHPTQTRTSAEFWGDLDVTHSFTFRRMCATPKALGEALNRLRTTAGWVGRIHVTDVRRGDNRAPTRAWQLSKVAVPAPEQ